ncbi:MAG: RluA family pseudouridine synthase [Culturomica sp.]|jgi:23S rRNA pseudouridine1911/1915/1917 synthase|nr:RluA family pseudouridine synthase [Culturomica sp.]
MNTNEDINENLFEDAEYTDELFEESNELHEHHRIIADKGQELLRIDKFLMSRLPHVSRTKIQQAADAGNILVNQISVKPNYKVKPHDIVSVVLSYPKRDFEIIPEDIPLNIIYEDDELLVINKNAGMVVHPAFGHFSGTLVNALAWHLKDNPLFQGSDFRPGLVHRIDKDTSGLLVVAKTEEAKSKLALQFFNKTSSRRYTAVCWGNLKEESGTITGNIGRHPVNRKTMSVYKDGSQGKHAVTHYKVIEHLGYVDTVECVLETGRTHQIRAHFKSIGHPLFNDAEYGGNEILRGTTSTKYKQFVRNCFEICPRQALHAKTLGFKHPKSGEEMQFDSELPNDMQTLIEKWRAYIENREI